MIKESRIFVDCDVSAEEANKKANKAIENGYLLTGQVGYTMIYEHPELEESVVQRHNEYIELCNKYL